jgi:hypothetical protein
MILFRELERVKTNTNKHIDVLLRIRRFKDTIQKQKLGYFSVNSTVQRNHTKEIIDILYVTSKKNKQRWHDEPWKREDEMLNERNWEHRNTAFPTTFLPKVVITLNTYKCVSNFYVFDFRNPFLTLQVVAKLS